MKIANSPITSHYINNRHFYLKRDDQLHPYFSGNKARKFMALLDNSYPKITTLVGYGSPQANSLYSMAALAQLKGWSLQYYVDHVPSWLINNPIGNYQAALELGATIVDLSQCSDRESRHPFDYINETIANQDDVLFVPEGGRSPIAEYGVSGLANEIICWADQQKIGDLTVALPSGTGTTALYLHKHLSLAGINVLTCACVGGEEYLNTQFDELRESKRPTILSSEKKHHFGKLYQRDYDTWLALKAQTGIEFDLLYDPLMWQCLSTWLPQNPHTTLLYIHQGGLLGNASMLPRYKRKYPKLNPS